MAPDYSNLFFWAAHPDKKDMSDSVPSFLRNETKDGSADVFFLHPTTFTKYMANASRSFSALTISERTPLRF